MKRKRLSCVNTIADWERGTCMLAYRHKGPVLFVAVAFSTSMAGLAFKCDLLFFFLFLLVVPLFCFAPFLSFYFHAYEVMHSQFSSPKLFVEGRWRSWVNLLFACNARFTSKIP